MSTPTTSNGVQSFSAETLALICSHVGDHTVDQALGTFSALARTSKQFSEPALNALWRSLPGIVALLFTLPADLWEIQERPHPRGLDEAIPMLALRRSIVPEDLARMRTYAARVKEIRLKHREPETPILICPTAWADLQRAISAPLFPNLISLTHSEASSTPGFENFLWRIDLLVGPKLQAVNVAVRKSMLDAQPASRVLATLSRQAPHIRRLDLSFIRSYGISSAASLGSEIQGLRNLVVFNAPAINLQPAALEHLAGLPHLAHLRIHTQLMSTATTAFPHGCKEAGRFPALRKARIYTNCFVWCAALVKTISSQHLQELHIENRSCPARAPVLEALLVALGGLPSASTLSSLTVYSGDDNACLHPGPTVISAEAVLPLASLTALTHLNISGWCEVVLTDAVLGTLSRSWPALEHLDLHFPLSRKEVLFRFPVSQPLVSLSGLKALARACPNLYVLSLPIDARVLPPAEPLRRGPPPPEVTRPSKLWHFDVGESPLRDAMMVGSFLSLVFPALQELYHGFDAETTPWHDCWDAYAMFVKAREQERKAHQRRLAAAAAAAPTNTGASGSA